MSQFHPNLQIKEPELEKYHNIIAGHLDANNLDWSSHYELSPNPEENSMIYYSVVLFGGENEGFITCVDGKFGGAVRNKTKIKYLIKEGFEDDQIITKEPILIQSHSPVEFVCGLALPVMDKLKFPRAEMKAAVKRIAAAKKTKKTQKKGKS